MSETELERCLREYVLNRTNEHLAACYGAAGITPEEREYTERRIMQDIWTQMIASRTASQPFGKSLGRDFHVVSR